jgi:hypothetical protein
MWNFILWEKRLEYLNVILILVTRNLEEKEIWKFIKESSKKIID